MDCEVRELCEVREHCGCAECPVGWLSGTLYGCVYLGSEVRPCCGLLATELELISCTDWEFAELSTDRNKHCELIEQKNYYDNISEAFNK